MVREVVNSVILIVSDDLKRAYGWTGIGRFVITVKMCRSV